MVLPDMPIDYTALAQEGMKAFGAVLVAIAGIVIAMALLRICLNNVRDAFSPDEGKEWLPMETSRDDGDSRADMGAETVKEYIRPDDLDRPYSPSETRIINPRSTPERRSNPEDHFVVQRMFEEKECPWCGLVMKKNRSGWFVNGVAYHRQCAMTVREEIRNGNLPEEYS